MNGQYDPYYDFNGDGTGLRSARNRRGVVSAGAGAPPSLWGQQQASPRHSHGESGHVRPSPSSFPTYSPASSVPRVENPFCRSVSPSSFGSSGDDSLVSLGSDVSPIPSSKPAPPSFQLSNSTPGSPYANSHDAISRKVAEFDNHRPRTVKHIEIAPGLRARLRGAQETWSAVENDFYMPTTCVCCTMDIFCIMDAHFVICPVCRVVSPMEGSAPQGGFDGGVGLGFTMDDLQKWQREILQQQRERQQQQLHYRGW